MDLSNELVGRAGLNPAPPPFTAPMSATAKASQQNDKTPFLKLPYETRLAIYEYATAVNRDLRPIQVAERSNKFVWGAHHDELVGTEMGNRSTVRVSEEETLTVTQLLRTCRRTRSDLAGTPVFYRVNTFRFEATPQLHAFLAAITPERRKELREIVLVSCHRDYSDGWLYSKLGTEPRGLVNKHTITLLRDCRHLKSLNLVTGKRVTDPIPYAYGLGPDGAEQMLTAIPRYAASPADKKSFWQFPITITMGVTIPLGPPHYRETILIKVNGKTSFPAGSSDWHQAVQLFSKASDAIAQQNKRVQNRELLRVPGSTEEERGKAIAAAKVDFPGHIRTQQSRTGRRTRAQTRAEGDVTDWGTINRITPKYDQDGILAWDYSPVLNGIRWNESAESSIEVEVEFTSGDVQDGTRFSWEDIRHVADKTGIYRVRCYFTKLADIRVPDIQGRLEKIENTPSMKDIEVALGGVLVWKSSRDAISWQYTKDHLRVFKEELRGILRLAERRKAAEEAEKRAREEEASKAKEEAAKAAAKASKASKTSGRGAKKGSRSSRRKA